MSNIRANRIVDLAPGADVAADLKLDAAAITLAGLSGAATQAAVRDRSGRVVWRSRAGDGFRTVLAPGEYLVQVDGGGAEIEKPINVKAGEALTVDMTAP
jgi:hypothetical protein